MMEQRPSSAGLYRLSLTTTTTTTIRILTQALAVDASPFTATNIRAFHPSHHRTSLAKHRQV